MCQLKEMHGLSEPLSLVENVWLILKRGLRFSRNRWRLLRHAFRKNWDTGAGKKEMTEPVEFHPGDRVRVRPKEEIRKTLDGWNRYKGCRFMDEMWSHCGGTYQVYKRVNRMLDEQTMKMVKTKHMYLLDGLICHGSWPFKECDRSCYFFWKSAWLERAEA